MGLLSTTIHQHTHAAPYPQHIHNAPTVEQVRFLRELERSAVDSALNAIDLPGNVLGKLVTFNDMATGKSVAVFNLNGQQHRVTIPRKLGFDVTPQYAAQAALEALSEEIAKAILKEIPK